MSDVTVAPAAPAEVTPVNEVPINQNPVNTPNPIGDQAPAKPEPDDRTRGREAIERAYERALSPPVKTEKAKPKAAEAKPGHNNPPEETPRLNLKKRPDDQPQPERGEHGHFAPRQGDAQNRANVAQNRANPAQTAQPAQPTAQLPANAPYRNPPQRMSEQAKREWATIPESARGDIWRQQQEFAKAYNYYKSSHEAFQPLRGFHQLAQQHGTTLATAVGNYVSMEQKLREDPIAGLDQIVNNLGLVDPQTGQRLGLRDVAYHILTQTPDQLKAIQQGNAQTAASQQIGALHAEVKGLKDSLQQMHNDRVHAQTRSVIDQYATTHPRLDELGTAIEQEVKLGFDLDTAYRRADRLYPSTHAAQTRTTSAQTRTTDRSISGSPDVSSNGASKRRGPPPSAREAAGNAYDRVFGGPH